MENRGSQIFSLNIFAFKTSAKTESKENIKEPDTVEPGNMEISLDLYCQIGRESSEKAIVLPPVLLSGESQGQQGLVGCRLRGGTELDIHLKRLSSSSRKES